jgi:ADP-ribosylglycohydrolase
MQGRVENAWGMLIGLAVGDALGAPLEFQEARDPDNYITK